jgi:Uma2 family endonuclease
MSHPNYKFNYFSEAEYLEFEENSSTKHEYFEGEVFAMSGGSMNHQLLTGNAFGEIRNHLKGTPCLTFSSDMKVRADDGDKYFYPDVVVTCEKENKTQHFINSPRLIIEVLSKSTRKFDKDLKRQIYQTIPTLEEYVLIEQDHVEIQVCRKNQNWQSTFYFLGDDITFESIDLTLPVLEIYQRVDNEEMRDFLKALETKNEL